MHKARALFAFLVVAAATLAAAGTEPLTHETMWQFKRVGAPSISPDGQWVVFPVTNPAYDEKDQTSDLWLVATGEEPKPRQITFTKAAESGAAWSSDGKRIAFSAKREGDEQSQIYILELGGGEAQRITNVSTGAGSPSFSPDGKTLLFTSTVYPGAGDDEANKKAAKEEKDKKTKARIYDHFPIRNWDRWLDEKQVHLFVQPAEAGAKAKDLLAGTKLVAAPGFGGTGGGEGRDGIDGEWSPDGQWIVFAATTERTSSAFAEVAFDLYRVSASGGEPESIAHAAGGYGSPTFSPDGKTLYATFNANNGKVYNLNRLVGFDWPSMKNRRAITNPADDRSVGAYAITPSGAIYFTAEADGLVKIYSVAAEGGHVAEASGAGAGAYSGLRIAEKAAVAIALWGSSVNPAELVRVNLDSLRRRDYVPPHHHLTTFNVEKAKQIDWQPPRHFWFTSKAGQKIHNFIVLPPKFDPAKKYPLFVLMHGGAANMWTDAISLRWNYHLLAKPGYVMVMTNYRGSTGFGEAFAQSIQGDPLRGPADDILAGADEAIKQFPFLDASRQVAGGASYGGHLASAMEAWSGNRFKALVNHAGLVNLESQWGTSDTIFSRELMNLGPVWEQGETWKVQNPARFAKDFKTPMLLSVGEKDFRVPLNNTLENWALLQRLRIPSRLIVWPEENHWILNAENSRLFYKEVETWLARWVEAGAK